MSITVSQFLQLWLDAFNQEFGGEIKTVGFHSPINRDPVETPAILLDVEMIETGDDGGEGETPLQISLAVHCILGHKTKNLQIELWEFAARIYGLVRQNDLSNEKIEMPENIVGSKGEFKIKQEKVSGYDSRVVTFDQTIHLGESVWDVSGFMPTTIIFDGEEILSDA